MDTSLDYLAVSAVVLFWKMFAVSMSQGYFRFTSKKFVNPEDAKAFGGLEPASAESPGVLRAQAVWRNDLENIPIFLALGLLYVMLEASPTAAPWYFGVFTASRIIHTISYMMGLQPWRFLAFSTGVACLIGMSTMVLKAAW
jgi:glutathione S-transferase